MTEEAAAAVEAAEVDLTGITAPAEQVEPAPDAAEVVEPEPGGDEDELPDWARRELKRARDDAAKYRTEKQTYAKAFDGYDPDTQKWFLDEFVPALKADPQATIRAVATQLGITVAEAKEVVADAAEQTEQYLTKDEARAEAEAVFAAKEQERQRKADETAILSQAKDLGYDPDAAKGTPGAVDFAVLCIVARDHCAGDLGEAHKLIEAGRQQLIADHIAETEAAAKGHVKPVKGGGPSTKADESWKGDMKATAKAVRAYLDAKG